MNAWGSKCSSHREAQGWANTAQHRLHCHGQSASLDIANRKDGGMRLYAATRDTHWLATILANDISNCYTKVLGSNSKSAQSPSTGAFQEEVRDVRRGKTICTNSIVGESECNCIAENAARQAQVIVRTSRAQLNSKAERNTNTPRPLATWPICWACEVLTKCRRGQDGNMSWQRRRGEESQSTITLIG